MIVVLVAAVDVERLRHGTQTVRGIGIAVMYGVVFETPHVVISAGSLIEAKRTQIVDIGAFGMYQIAQKTFFAPCSA